MSEYDRLKRYAEDVVFKRRGELNHTGDVLTDDDVSLLNLIGYDGYLD